MANEIDILKRRLDREIKSRKAAEGILEAKAMELFEANMALKKLNENLELQVEHRTHELIENEKKYRHLIESASDIIFNINDKGYFTYLNPKGFELFGYDESEVIGKHFLNFIQSDYKTESHKVFKDLLDTSKESIYKKVPILTKHGEVKWIGQNINRITNSDNSYYFSSVARDITSRILTEEKLEKARKNIQRSELKYRGIMENMQLGLMEVNTEGIITKTYDRFNKMMGYKPQELLGKKPNEVFLIKGQEGEIKQQEKSRKIGKSGVYEMKLRKKDGSHIWVLISGAPFYDENENLLGSIGIHYDITDRKELQFKLEKAQNKAIKAQEAEKQFLASMSHEIRTPLNAIIGMNYLLKETPLNSEQKDYLKVMMSSANLLKHLIADILDLSKIDSGHLEPNLTEFDLEKLILNAHNLFEFNGLENQVEFKTNAALNLEHLVISDSQFINQVFVNLLGNAEKFTEEGTITLGANLIHQDKDSYSIKFYVSDTGTGIKSKNLDKIFNRFTQENSKIRTKYGGTGLGLPICKEMVQLLGGELKLTSKLGKGSKFFFTLRFKKGKKISQKSSDSFSLQQPKLLSTGKILIAEDNLMNCKYIENLFVKWNLEFQIVHNGEEAISKNASVKFDLILMDLQMPKKDGFEATKEIIEYNKQRSWKVPIVALTASSFTSNKDKALSSGMIDFLTKPFSPQQLVMVLNKYLPKKVKNVSLENGQEFEYVDGLDKHSLKESYGEDYTHAQLMFETFLENIHPYIQELNSNLNSGNVEASKKFTHKMKPIFTMVGLNKLTDQMEVLENQIDLSITNEGIELWNQLKSDILKYIPLLKNQVEIFKTHQNKA